LNFNHTSAKNFSAVQRRSHRKFGGFAHFSRKRLGSALDDAHWTVVVAVVAVGVVQVSVDEVVDVIAVGHRLVAAAVLVDVRGIVSTAGVIRRAQFRIGSRDFQAVFENCAIGGLMVQVPVVEVVGVPIVSDGRVAAVGAMLVIVIVVRVRGHCEFSGEGAKVSLIFYRPKSRVHNGIHNRWSLRGVPWH